MSRKFEDMRDNAEQFWEERYKSASHETSGRPGKALRQFAEPLTPGQALELGAWAVEIMGPYFEVRFRHCCELRGQ